MGGGFTGLLTAINLLRFGSGPVALVERGELGGAAYGGHDRGQLLNVRAGKATTKAGSPAAPITGATCARNCKQQPMAAKFA